jgi:hypothetical protein
VGARGWGQNRGRLPHLPSTGITAYIMNGGKLEIAQQKVVAAILTRDNVSRHFSANFLPVHVNSCDREHANSDVVWPLLCEMPTGHKHGHQENGAYRTRGYLSNRHRRWMGNVGLAPQRWQTSRVHDHHRLTPFSCVVVTISHAQLIPFPSTCSAVLASGRFTRRYICNDISFREE